MEEKIIKLPFEIVESVLLVSGKVNGCEGSFIFDTGCEQTSINNCHCQIINSLTENIAVYENELKEISVVSGEIEDLHIGQLHLNNYRVLSMNLSDTENDLKVGENKKFCLLGTIGMDIICQYNIEIDYTKKIILLNPYEQPIADGCVEFDVYNNIMIITAQVDNQKGCLMLDSGANVCVLDGDKFLNRNWKVIDSTQQVYSIPNIKIGNKNYSDILAICSNFEVLKSSHVDGIIGLSTLQASRVLIYFKDKKIIIEK